MSLNNNTNKLIEQLFFTVDSHRIPSLITFTISSIGDPTSSSTPIEWKEGKDLVKKAEEAQNQQGNKRKMIMDRTFFQWFCDNSEPASDDIAEVRTMDRKKNLQYSDQYKYIFSCCDQPIVRSFSSQCQGKR